MGGDLWVGAPDATVDGQVGAGAIYHYVLDPTGAAPPRLVAGVELLQDGAEMVAGLGPAGDVRAVLGHDLDSSARTVVDLDPSPTAARATRRRTTARCSPAATCPARRNAENEYRENLQIGAPGQDANGHVDCGEVYMLDQNPNSRTSFAGTVAGDHLGYSFG